MAGQENTNVVEFMKWVEENKYGMELKPTAEHFPTSYKCWTWNEALYEKIYLLYNAS